MAYERAPISGTRLNYQPLAVAIAELLRGRTYSYLDVASAAHVPFPKILHLMSGDDVQMSGINVVNLARLTGLPLSELIAAEEEVCS